jgi:hypothetical protein
MNRHHGRGRPPLPRGQVCEHRVVDRKENDIPTNGRDNSDTEKT